MTGVYIGVDVGGSKVLAGVVDDRGRVGRTSLVRTPGRRVDVESVEDALTEAMLEAAHGEPLAGVGVAAAGFVDAAGQRVMFAPHLPWAGEPVRDRLAQRWQVPIALANDANCAALAEHELGAARGSSSALMITLGTGVGGALVIDGKIVTGWNGMAGEFGHLQVVPHGRVCECGRTGCWEQYASGSALLRFVRDRVGVEPTVLHETCDGPTITAAAQAGDPVAREAFAAVGEWLGVGVANLVAAFDPEVVVVGGGVADAGETLLEPARAALARSLVGAAYRDVPGMVAAELGPHAGLVGAVMLVRAGAEVSRPDALTGRPDR